MFSFFICVVVNASLHGMDRNYGHVIREIIIANIDRDMHRTLAPVDTTYNKIIEDTYRPDKKPIENFIKWKSCDVTGYKSWNKDFSKCAWVTISDSDPGKKNLQLTLVGLVNDDINRVMSSSRLWYDFYCPVFEDDVRPFFDKDGRACFYGFGKTTNRYRHEISLIECSIGLDGEAECCACQFVTVAQKGYGNTVYWGDKFLSFPILLKAWLKSKRVRISDPVNASKSKIYNIKAVTFPDDYKTFKKHVGLENCYALCKHKRQITPYACLPEELRIAIDERYEEQQREKIVIEKK